MADKIDNALKISIFDESKENAYLSFFFLSVNESSYNIHVYKAVLGYSKVIIRRWFGFFFQKKGWGVRKEMGLKSFEKFHVSSRYKHVYIQ